MTTSASLAFLPGDIIIVIFGLLSVEDVLALKQTCRMLHALGSSDYLWHQISTRVPFPLDAPNVDTRSLPAFELQRLVVKGLALDHNWKATCPRVKECTAVNNGGNHPIDEMQLLPGARWLVTAQRMRRLDRPITTISLWFLKNSKEFYLAAFLDVPGQYKRFAVAPRSDRDTATLAITTYAAQQKDKSVLQIYELPLTDPSEPAFRYATLARLLKSFPNPSESSGSIDEIAVHDSIVAAMFVDFDAPFPGHAYNVFLVNTSTWTHQMIHPKFTEPLNRLSLKLASNRLVLVGVTTDTIVVRVLQLPHTMTQSVQDQSFRYRPSTDEEEGSIKDLGFLADMSISLAPNRIDSDTLIYHSSSIPDYITLLFFDLLDGQPGYGHLVRLHLGDRKASYQWHDEPFPFPADTSVKLVRIGTTGRRAIWFEKNWETEEQRVVRCHFPEESVDASSVSVLLPPAPALPFTPRMCQSAAFDEAAGRLCLGLMTGALWVLDFV
ncbi:hypothetical protein BC834DRAFT_883408 [Gloeopeniophorella convolvens]|nr:hypothetical protein BC834DRAFT_883408 [Gloeopeniophorella convolvens]